MARGINNNAYKVKNAASSLASSVKNTLGFSIPKEGPLSDADTYMPDFMDLMAKGIRSSKKVLLSSIRELAETMSGAFTGLGLPELQTGQLALAGAGATTNNRTVNVGGINVTVNGYNATNDDDLADTVVHRINEMLNEDGSVWGR